MIFAATDKRDLVANLRKTASMAFLEDPQNAIATGLTDEYGVPLDPRPTWSTGNPNPGFAKPLAEHSYIRTLYGIALKSSDEEAKPMFFTLTLRDKVAENDNIPMYKSVKFRAIDKSTDTTSYTMNASMYTTFEEINLDLPSPTELITKFCSELTVNMDELNDYHEANKADYNRMAIVKGDVSTLALEATSTGNRRLVIESEDIIDNLDAAGVTCWIPPHINLDFAENSKIIVFGSTSQGFKYENGAKTDELGDVMLNAFGVYAIPEYKVQIETEEITEENTVTEEVPQIEEVTEPVINNTQETKSASSW